MPVSVAWYCARSVEPLSSRYTLFRDETEPNSPTRLRLGLIPRTTTIASASPGYRSLLRTLCLGKFALTPSGGVEECSSAAHGAGRVARACTCRWRPPGWRAGAVGASRTCRERCKITRTRYGAGDLSRGCSAPLNQTGPFNGQTIGGSNGERPQLSVGRLVALTSDPSANRSPLRCARLYLPAGVIVVRVPTILGPNLHERWSF
jgi:hypothetical protein